MTLEIKKHEFPRGMTVAQLRSIVSMWPVLKDNGDAAEVWIETGPGLSSPVTQVWPLNKRGETADLELSTDAYGE